MQLMELQSGTLSMQSRRESTRILKQNSRNGTQQIFDRGFGKTQNTDFEPLHYQDT